MLPQSARAPNQSVSARFNWHERAGPKVRWIHPAIRLMREPQRESRVYFDSPPRRDQPAVSQLAELISASSLASL
jgi:hypothetical protein